MRTAVWIALALIIAALIIHYWAFLSRLFFDSPASPPGQYPIGAPRWEWPVTIREKAYAPTGTMGEDRFTASDAADRKTICVTSASCGETGYI